MADASTVAAAFETKFHHWEHTDGSSRVLMVNSFSLPAEVAQYVDFIEGLTEFPVPGYKAKPSPMSPETLVAISPQSINTIYKIPSGFTSTGNSSVVRFLLLLVSVLMHAGCD